MPFRYSGKKRERYLQATDSLIGNPWTYKDSMVKMFVKCEKIKLSSGKPNPDPRAIQARSPRYCVELARYLHPIEEQIYPMMGNRINKLPRGRLIGKGLNSVERASLLVSKWGAFEIPVCLSLDCTRFDLHVNESLLEVEHALYKVCNSDPLFQRLLEAQLSNKGVTSKGLKYRCPGGRMSGDMNTALGNCIIMITMVASFFEDANIKYNVLDDGDDCLVLIESSDLEYVQKHIGDHFLSCGHVVKIENVAWNLESIEWCQSRPINYKGERWKFVRDPWKVMSTSLVSPKWRSYDMQGRAKYLNTIGMCELALNLGVPVLQEYACALMRNANNPGTVFMSDADNLWYRVRRELRSLRVNSLAQVHARPITDEARLSFAMAFGIDVSSQLLMEEYLRTWNFQFTGDREWGSVVDVDGWTPNPEYTRFS
jgi:hypothetical protein